MPNDLRTIFLQSDKETKKRILDGQALVRIQREKSKVDKTFAAQKGKMDKILMGIYYSIKKDSPSQSYLLSDEEKFDLGFSSKQTNDPEEERKETQINNQIFQAIIPEPTLKNFREFYFLTGMINAKAVHGLGQELKQIKESLDPSYDEETKEKLSMLLAYKGESMSQHIQNYTSQMINNMNHERFPGKEFNYDALLSDALEKDIINKLGPENPSPMTVNEFLNLLKATPEERASFLGNYACKPEDRLFDAYEKIHIEQDTVNRRKVNRITDEQARAAKKRQIIVENICDFYVKQMPNVWSREGEDAYKKGLTNTALEEFKDGRRVLGFRSSSEAAFRNEMTAKGIDHRGMLDKTLHDNAILKYRTVTEKTTSGQPLNTKYEPGISEAIAADIPDQKKIERLQVTSGALKKLSSLETVWKYHSSDSKKYTNVVNALKAYNEALARGDGGKIHEERNKLVKYGLAYIDGKETKRREFNGQERFDTVMTLLHKELKAEEFAKIINKINNKRRGKDPVFLSDYEARTQEFVNSSMSMESAIQHQSLDNRKQTLDAAALDTVSEMDALYGPVPQQTNPENNRQSTFTAVGRKGLAEAHKLSVKDYASLTFASALSSPNRKGFLYEEDVLKQENAAIEDGRRAANIALNAYAAGDKTPLANLIRLGIQRLPQETENMSSTRKDCMQEMSDRLISMLDRDPELQKYAMRQGLKEEEIDMARDLNASRNINIQNTERLNSLIDIQV